MSRTGFLRRLDQRVLPPVGRALSGFRRGTRRTRFVMVVASVLSLAVVLVTVYVATRSPDPTRAQRPMARVGVSAGVSIKQYAQHAANRLNAQVHAAHPKPTFALVSLRTYVTPQQLPDIAGTALVQRVYTHVFVAGARTDIHWFETYRDLVRDMQDIGRRLDTKADDDANLQKMVTGDSTEDGALRQQYNRQEALYRAEAKAYASPKCVCVFAIVVFAEPALLASIAAADAVRAVDPVVYSGPLSDIEFAPPRPEETGRADSQDGS